MDWIADRGDEIILNKNEGFYFFNDAHIIETIYL